MSSPHQMLIDVFTQIFSDVDPDSTPEQRLERFLSIMYLEYARQKREMIPWTVPWPAIQDPAEGEWTSERISAGFYLLNQLIEVGKLVVSAAVCYLTGKGWFFEPSSDDEDDIDDSDEDDMDDEDFINILLEEPSCLCTFNDLAPYFPDDQKALDCLDKMKAACHDRSKANLRRCMETYEETFDSAVYICELVGSPGEAQKVKDFLDHIPARTRELAREVAGRVQLQLVPE